MKKVAALDLGTNTFLCLIADGDENGIRKVYRDLVQVVRLGQGVGQAGEFHPDALDRAKKCLTEFKKEIEASVDQELSLLIESMKLEQQGLPPEQIQQMIQEMRTRMLPQHLQKKNFSAQGEITFGKILQSAIERQGVKDKKLETLKDLEIGHLKTTYRGVKAYKSPFDYVMYQMIINEIKPDLVIEIGTYDGGGALYIADLMEIIGHGEIHTIDIDDRVIDTNVIHHKRIKRFLDGYQNYDTSQISSYEKVLVIDGGLS